MTAPVTARPSSGRVFLLGAASPPQQRPHRRLPEPSPAGHLRQRMTINDYYRDDGQYDPDEIIDMLGRLGNLIQMERKMQNYKNDITSEKRAFDLGLGRGYSGALQAKHLMGLAAANFAGGPGRRRRNAQ
ncbi:diuretic hormone class 2-like [Bombyx mandarina]|uniref:Diuretic hormone class 2-like n=1 Tax=Bombyx mandarina TaxID=7092 RepID=A0A6J2JWQ3_BOMMA|nr:diuretic hormone class 2-like [Bombyx mandarina]